MFYTVALTFIRIHGYRAGADSRLRMVTIAPSEPLLVEVAFKYLYYTYGLLELFSKIFAANLDTWGIHQGDGGEFVMSLIWMAARDAAVVKISPNDLQERRPWNPYHHSVISIMDFMEKLLPSSLCLQVPIFQVEDVHTLKLHLCMFFFPFSLEFLFL